MRKKYQPTPSETATLVVHLISEYAREKAKATTRARISQQTLRLISSRTHLRSRFKDDWAEAMELIGWLSIPVGDNFAIIKTDTTDGWPRIGSKRIAEVLKRVHRGDVGIIAEIEEGLEDPIESADDD
ncbi:hypothetical protein [Methylobacterium radiotolerans]